GVDVDARTAELAEALRGARLPVWIVTNEVGLGIVPGDALSRRYRDQLGRCNQRVAAVADRVTLMVAGIPLRIK
ncbi:MAG: bifunctional adenosylcobinamide kinase/adenosylcobinamide-phosphate guanylyltransferase, partial [Myxococcota bacterium]